MKTRSFSLAAQILRNNQIAVGGGLNKSQLAPLVHTVTPRPNEPPMTTHGDYRLASQINTSLSSALWPHSYAPGKTSYEVAHPKIVPHQARLTVEFLANWLP